MARMGMAHQKLPPNIPKKTGLVYHALTNGRKKGRGGISISADHTHPVSRHPVGVAGCWICCCLLGSASLLHRDKQSTLCPTDRSTSLRHALVWIGPAEVYPPESSTSAGLFAGSPCGRAHSGRGTVSARWVTRDPDDHDQTLSPRLATTTTRGRAERWVVVAGQCECDRTQSEPKKKKWHLCLVSLLISSFCFGHCAIIHVM